MISWTRFMETPTMAGHAFPDLSTWQYAMTIGRALFAEKPQAGDIERYAQLSGRTEWPSKPFREAHIIAGRRSGKTRLASAIADFMATRKNYRDALGVGETAVIALLAADRPQTRVLQGNIIGICESPLLRSMVTREVSDGLAFTTGAEISVHTSSFRSIRGRTFAAVVCDELCYWTLEGANPADEILNAVRPGLATLDDSLLLCISSPYRRDGPMFAAWQKHWGMNDSPVLVVKAPSRLMNPTLPQSVVDQALQDDPQRAAAEYLSEWRSDIQAALDPDWIDNALTLPNLDVPRSEHARPYRAFVDMSGGRSDAAALSIAHCEPDSPTVIVSLVRRWTPPFSPEGVVDEMCDLCRSYGLHQVTGDNYAGELVCELFTKAGVSYQRSADFASDLYMQMIPMLSTGRVQAPDNPVLRNELTMLERRTRTSGKDLVTHPPGAHDDMANAFAGAAVNAWRARQSDFRVIPGRAMETFAGDGALAPAYDGPSPWRNL